jgi:6-phosphogluconate dehydrogenase
MQIGMIGLGKMGGNMSRRLMKAGHQCVVYARTAKTREALAKTAPQRQRRLRIW